MDENKIFKNSTIAMRKNVIDYLDKSVTNKFTTDDRHKIMFKTWFVVTSVFGVNIDSVIWSELEMIKLQSLINY